MEPRRYDQGGPLIAHRPTFDIEWNPECGHHFTSFCDGCSTCTDCAGNCRCAAAEDDDEDIAPLRHAS
ncbi:hypothetical protein ACQPZ2_30755 [Nocardia pseudovaccinii]|uniref:hypothetical protein n=1 Tax=Nocardia pseudovaccinii TaxID=189540 RepID=UPI003D90EA75